ncbi:hypothetical protein LIER_06549 [Lithospermum erythrorhizon]|uniref:DRBM domain-containing protein n=1 Tax=Lithospermum erythrorhizon TaxID=34254 RepID=A0AAV3P582_LITER
MYKNQLQELAQRSCFNLPSYSCIREGPDHAPRFKAAVNFNGETFESPAFCSTLRQAEHSAAEVALDSLSNRGPSNSLAARILDETGVYKNLLQEVSQRVGASLPAYTTFRSGLGHHPVFTCTVELAGVAFTGDPAKNKKQAEKNAAMAAWSSLKLLAQESGSSSQKANTDEQEHVTVARSLQKFLIKARLARVQFPIKFPTQSLRPPSTQPSQPATSKILPFISPRTAHRSRSVMNAANNSPGRPKTSHSEISASSLQDALTFLQTNLATTDSLSSADNQRIRPQKFPAAGAAPYIPLRHFSSHHRVAPPVTIRNAIPVFSAPPAQPSLAMRHPSLGMAPPVCIRQAVPVYAAPPVLVDERAVSGTSFRMDTQFPKVSAVQVKELQASKAAPDQGKKSSTPAYSADPVEQAADTQHPPVLPKEEAQVAKSTNPQVVEESDPSLPVASSGTVGHMKDGVGAAGQGKLQDSPVIEGVKELKI